MARRQGEQEDPRKGTYISNSTEQVGEGGGVATGCEQLAVLEQLGHLGDCPVAQGWIDATQQRRVSFGSGTRGFLHALVAMLAQRPLLSFIAFLPNASPPFDH